MQEYLIGFTYHEPEPFSLWQRGVIEDYESSTGLWINADTPADAIAWAERVAEALHREVNGEDCPAWKEADHWCWIEENPATCSWRHCLDFFQRVHVGEMPPLKLMGSEAYGRWQEKNTF
jgi:hypothetical protein